METRDILRLSLMAQRMRTIHITEANSTSKCSPRTILKRRPWHSSGTLFITQIWIQRARYAWALWNRTTRKKRSAGRRFWLPFERLARRKACRLVWSFVGLGVWRSCASHVWTSWRGTLFFNQNHYHVIYGPPLRITKISYNFGK